MANLTATLIAESITIHYSPSHREDAQWVASVIPLLLSRLKAYFQDDSLTGLKSDFYLYPNPNGKASEQIATGETGTTDGTLATYYARFHFLTPSAYAKDARNSIGEFKDRTYFERLIVSEIAAAILDRITRLKPYGWRFHDAPDWFVQGYEEYLSLVCSNEHNRTVALPKFIELVRSHPEGVRNDCGLTVRDPYSDGTVLLAFLHEHYGQGKVLALLNSPAEAFDKAITQTFSVQSDTLFATWKGWLGRFG